MVLNTGMRTDTPAYLSELSTFRMCFVDYMMRNEIRTQRIYLSLGDKEEKTRNPIMATVGDRMRESYLLLQGQGVQCVLEWNAGNHFKESDLRTARAFAWVVKCANRLHRSSLIWVIPISTSLEALTYGMEMS